MLFKLANLENELDKPLTTKILSDPEHKVVKHILYIYSMESFIYEDLNRVCREKDKTKIKFYGAFAAALSFIIYSANQNRISNKLHRVTTLYRGVKLTEVELEQYNQGYRTNLLGYTSTSLDFKIALKFCFKRLDNQRVPVVFEISFKGSNGLFQLTDDFSAYPDELEVLVQDGLTYRVTDNLELAHPETK